MKRWTVLVVLALALAVLPAGAAQYTIVVENGIDSPDRQVSLEGNTFTVRGITAVTPGESVTASVTVPEDAPYRVYVYGTLDGSRVLLDTTYVEDHATVTIDTTGYPPGSYMLALHANGDYRAVYPFIVTGATTQVTAPQTVTAGDTLHVTATTSPISDAVSITGVQFALYNPQMDKRVTATRTNGRYEATIETHGLPPGDYTLYAIVTNDSTTTRGEREPIALSTRHTITIESATDSSISSTTTATPPQNTTTTTTPPPTTPTTTHPTTTPPPTTPTTTTLTPTATTTRTTSTTGTSSDVITPNPSTTTPAAAPGLTIPTTVLALGVLGARLTHR